MEAFQGVQQMLAGKGTGRKHRERQETQHSYMFRGLLHCGICNRRMQGQQSKQRLYYRCRFPNEYALANTIDHPRNVYLNEADLLAPLDDWLAGAFAPERWQTPSNACRGPSPTSLLSRAPRPPPG